MREREDGEDDFEGERVGRPVWTTKKEENDELFSGSSQLKMLRRLYLLS